jgi:hypothetical protein
MAWLIVRSVCPYQRRLDVRGGHWRPEVQLQVKAIRPRPSSYLSNTAGDRAVIEKGYILDAKSFDYSGNFDFHAKQLAFLLSDP